MTFYTETPTGSDVIRNKQWRVTFVFVHVRAEQNITLCGPDHYPSDFIEILIHQQLRWVKYNSTIFFESILATLMKGIFWYSIVKHPSKVEIAVLQLDFMASHVIYGPRIPCMWKIKGYIWVFIKYCDTLALIRSKSGYINLLHSLFSSNLRKCTVCYMNVGIWKIWCHMYKRPHSPVSIIVPCNARPRFKAK